MRDVDIATTHNPDSYTENQIAEMLLVHACMDRGPLWATIEPEFECGDECKTCRRLNA